MDKPKSIWDLLTPLDTSNPESKANQVTRRKIVYSKNETETTPIAKSNPIPILSSQSSVRRPDNNQPSPTSNDGDGDSEVNIYSATHNNSSKSKQAEPVSSQTAQNKTHTETKINTDGANTDKAINPWPLVGAIILIILIIAGAYYFNKKIKNSRKDRPEKDDDFIDSFFNSKAGDAVRFGGIAFGLFLAAIALLYSTKVLARGIQGVQETLRT